MSGLEPVIIRNGRSTSEISIYDYPEHLNPFYEDDNHKRLRFWKIGKKSGDGRRGSFSLSGLKEMWAFKSFRLKKKSSNLGVNKTSESPPPLRREIEPNGIYYGTYDPRMRYTTGNNTLSHSPFQRNVPYRSSLQDMRGTETIAYSGDFIRNNRYRSTIQTPGQRTEGSGCSPRVPARRYVYGGSITPQPNLRSNNYGDDFNAISRGSSQISVASTNPFEDDDDDVVIGRLSTAQNNVENGVQTPTKRPARKKRRAPPPPIPVSKVIVEESSNPSTPTTSQTNQNIEKVENSEIANLTAEIENFVKTTTDSSENLNTTNEISNNTNPTITITTVNENQEVAQRDKVVATKTTTVVDSQEKIKGNKEITTNTTDITIEVSSTTTADKADVVDTQTVEELKRVEVTQPTNDIFVEDVVVVRENSLEKDTPEQLPTVVTDIEEQEASERVENVNENNLDKSETNTEIGLSIVELKITESKEDLSERSERSEHSEISELSERSEISNEPIRNSRFQIRYIPLKDSSPESEPEMRTSTPIQLHDDIEETNGVVTYERRRSVKEIIESINRSQSLLKVNQEQNNTPIKCDTVINNLNQPQAPPRKKIEERSSLAQNFKELAESEREIKKMIDEMDHTDIDHARRNYDEKEVNVIIDKLTDKLNNNEDTSEMFKKCTIKKEINRESSPTASNLDWNPVPKPKRTKNLSPELTKASFKQNNIQK